MIISRVIQPSSKYTKKTVEQIYSQNKLKCQNIGAMPITDPLIIKINDLIQKITKGTNPTKKQLAKASKAIVDKVIDDFSPMTAVHSKRVAELATGFAKNLGWKSSKIQELKIAAELHDIGKLKVPISMLNSPTNQLTAEKRAIIHTHAEWSKKILEQIEPLLRLKPKIIKAVAEHHVDFKPNMGYPAQPTRPSQRAEVLALADVYEALTSPLRSYRTPASPKGAIEIMEKMQETDAKWSPYFFGHFKKWINSQT